MLGHSHFRSYYWIAKVNGALCIERIIILHVKYLSMNDSDKKTMPICFTPDQLKLIESYAKKKGMFNPSQAIEYIIERR